jgi:CelD/BcsL family acetyltransferase involved in cellulose biosynthesis
MRNVDRALLGRANRWLHWRDMLHFKQMDLRCYDWGGVFEDESNPKKAGINTFKREFGGNSVRTFNCSVAATLRGRAYLAVRHIVDRFEADSHC